MNILYINHYAGSPELGMEFRPHKMARYWLNSGHHVQIVASSFSHLRRKNPQTSKYFQFESVEGVPFLWIKGNSYKGNGLFRLMNIFTFIIGLFIKSISISRNFKPQVVIASSTYPLDIFPAWLIAKLTGSRLIFEVHDLWPLSPMEIGQISRWHPLMMLFQLGEDFACKYADKVISLLPYAHKHLETRGMHPCKFVYVPNGIEINEWVKISPAKDLKVNEIKSKIEDLKGQGKMVLGYLGGHGPSNYLEILILAAAKSQELNLNLNFVLVGSGPEKHKLIELSNKFNLQNIFYFDPISKSDIPYISQFFDVFYMGFKHSKLYQFGVSPNKIMDYMAAKKPIIFGLEKEVNCVAQVGCGFGINSESIDELIVAIQDFLKLTSEEKNHMGELGFEFVKKNHEYSVLSNKFIRVCCD